MFSIGSVFMTGRLVLAPLAGYSDLPFRLLCRMQGAALCYSEMISSHGLVYNQPATLAMLESCREDRPVAFQLFGADPDVMGEAAALLNRFCPNIIDINMGCPVRKVTKRGAGAALMSNLELAGRIIRSVVDNSSSPVTVKCRSGPDHSTINAVRFAQLAENAGAAAITVHGRTWKQAFSGTADWTIVKSVKQAVNIPVIGNGDINSFDDAFEKRQTTGCDAVMIGRAALGNPWIFSNNGRPRQLSGLIEGVRTHLSLLETYGRNHRLGSIKNHLGRYFKGFSGASQLRAAVYEAPDMHALLAILEHSKQTADQTFGTALPVKITDQSLP